MGRRDALFVILRFFQTTQLYLSSQFSKWFICLLFVYWSNVCLMLAVVVDRPVLMEKPDVVVGTPSRVLAHLKAQNLVLHSSLETLVIDEADLLFSFGFEADLKSLLW